MKKLFLFIPVGLLAATGIAWLGLEYSSPTDVSGKTAKSPEELFTQSQNSYRSILRNGDKDQISHLEESLKNLENSLALYEQKGLNVDKVEWMIKRYKDDSIQCAKAGEPFLDKLHKQDGFERSNRDTFNTALEQIGLYELNEANSRLDKKRLDYIKEPTQSHKEDYLYHISTMKQTITELYLDGVIEKPLFEYLDNHKGYYETIASMYDKAGSDRVLRVQQNAYAIKTELQMLPKL